MYANSYNFTLANLIYIRRPNISKLNVISVMFFSSLIYPWYSSNIILYSSSGLSAYNEFLLMLRVLSCPLTTQACVQKQMSLWTACLTLESDCLMVQLGQKWANVSGSGVSRFFFREGGYVQTVEGWHT